MSDCHSYRDPHFVATSNNATFPQPDRLPVNTLALAGLRNDDGVVEHFLRLGAMAEARRRYSTCRRAPV